ncbi:nucleotidyltransferase [Stygiolobus caldivivus]|uniref:Nucleotidyltransferase n=1 Tax=Stygiolobus caldivivus TaxID=2824673 RepID=A0A8D5U7Y7_9CREN|nr:nucleotidyltransferase [Stygiolobus caldivivus]BCU70419.1 nucleotidyltransferase [Stygiolobus caldivivus]
MGRGYFLDKDVLVDKDWDIYLVYSNVNPYGYVYAMLKYTYTGKGLWRGYERVLKYYGVKNMVRLNQEFSMEPCNGVTFPILKLSRVFKHLKPEEKVTELIRRSPKSMQEAIFLDVYTALGVTEVGVTGSLLVGINHSKSDLDVVVYGCKNALDVMSNFNGFEEDKEWVIETSRNYGLSIDHSRQLYDKRMRGLIKGVKFSILFVDPRPQRPCKDVCKRRGEITIKAELESGDCKALFYPSEVPLYNVNILSGETKLRPKILVSYEGIYSALLFSSRKIEAKGMLVECERPIIVVGDRDVPGYIRRVL